MKGERASDTARVIGRVVARVGARASQKDDQAKVSTRTRDIVGVTQVACEECTDRGRCRIIVMWPALRERKRGRDVFFSHHPTSIIVYIIKSTLPIVQHTKSCDICPVSRISTRGQAEAQ